MVKIGGKKREKRNEICRGSQGVLLTVANGLSCFCNGKLLLPFLSPLDFSFTIFLYTDKFVKICSVFFGKNCLLIHLDYQNYDWRICVIRFGVLWKKRIRIEESE